MRILCFGTFAEVLRVCCRGYVGSSKRNRNETVPQRRLVGELLNAVDTSRGKDWTDGDNSQQLSRKLLRCEQHIPDDLKHAAETVKASVIAEHFKENLIPLIEKSEVAVLAIRDIIKNDFGMTDSIIATYFRFESKQQLLAEKGVNIFEFLVNAFIYAIKGVDNKKGKGGIKEVDETYILSFQAHIDQIRLDTSYLASTSSAVNSSMTQRSLFELEVSNDFTPSLDDWELVLEVGGECPECGKRLSKGKNDRSLPRYKIVVIDKTKSDSPTNRIAMCPECYDGYILETSSGDIDRVSRLKQGFVSLVRSREALSENRVPIEMQIEEVLKAIELTPEVSLKRISDDRVYEVERKVTESVLLMRKIRGYALEYFECVEALLKATDRARSQKFRLFQSKVITCYEEANANETSQEKIYNHLVDWLYRQAKYTHKTACEIIIAYFVQICDVFEPEAEGTEYAVAK